jgi:hypothetical protein
MNIVDFHKHVLVLVRLHEVSADFRVLQLDLIYLLVKISKVWAPYCLRYSRHIPYIIVGYYFKTSFDIY